MKYNVGDKFILEVEEVEKGKGYPYGVTGNYSVSSKFLDSLPMLVKGVDTYSYHKGLADAWELASKVFFDSDLGGFETSEIKEIFGTVYAAECFKGDIHEAIKKYKEMQEKVDWSTVEVDTPILVKMKQGTEWEKRHFAKYENGKVYAWGCGRTSWSYYPDEVSAWDMAKLPEE